MEPRFSFEHTPGKLPKHVRPIAYRVDLDLTPDLAKIPAATGQPALAFTGQVQIEVEVLKPTDAITLHALDITFHAVAIDGAAPSAIVKDEQAQTATFRLAQPLAPGRHAVAIDYAGQIIPQPAGIYYVFYKVPSGQRRIVTTQFEPTDARRMLPCWDEPVFKATFALTAVIPEDFKAVANMPLNEQPAGPGKKKIRFTQPSPKMSTYLLALIAGEIDPSIRQTVADVDIGVFAPEGRAEEGRYALDVMSQVLPYYNAYFAVSYPLPKCDLIAIPDFAAGAMENWGAITYADNRLLFNPQTSAQRTREDIFAVVAHEMAHQWSGNLVTMAWWDNLWLNEGFATWMEKKATDHFNPSWKIWLRAHDSKERAMARDARFTAHAVQQEITDESQIENAFDTISYDKGGALIRMIEDHLGEVPFRDGMRRYMQAHAYASSTTADLWAALDQAENGPAAQIAATFVEYPGIPLIRATTHSENNETVLTLRQERFTINHPYAEKRVWQVPVTVGQVGGTEAPRRLVVGEQPQVVRFPGIDARLKVNFGGVGYYRVQYDEAGMQALSAAYRQLAAADRVNLLADSWALVQAARVGAQSYLALTKQLADETELVVWKSVIDALREIDNLAQGSVGRPAFRAYATSLLQPVLARLGWEPRGADTLEDTLLRALVITSLGRFGDQAVIAEARRRFAEFVADPATLNQDLREPVVVVVGFGADQTAYDELHRRASQAANLPNGRVTAFLARAASENDDPDRLWQLVLERHADILNRLTEGHKQKLLPLVARACWTPFIAFQVKWAKQSRSSRGARYEADKAVEEIEFKAEFRERLLPAVDAWISGEPPQ
jgi:aminopeptidase N